MEISPNRLIAICAALFGGIVAINFIAQYRSNEEFKANFGTGLDFSALRARLNREEGIATEQTVQQDESVSEEYESEFLTQED